MAEPQELDGDLVKGKGIARSPGSRIVKYTKFSSTSGCAGAAKNWTHSRVAVS